VFSGASLGTGTSKGAFITIGKEPVVLSTLFAITIESLSLFLREKEPLQGKRSMRFARWNNKG